MLCTDGIAGADSLRCPPAAGGHLSGREHNRKASPMNKLLWLGLCAWLGLSLCPGRAAVWYVATNGDDAASGTNWAEAYATIGNALASNAIVAGENHEIWVSNGTYNLSAQLYLTKGVRLLGAGADKPILDGGMNIRCVFITNGILDGFIVTNGYAANAVGYRFGGGIYIVTGQVLNCTVAGNRGYYAGGGIFGESGGVGLVSNCVIAGNTSTNSGGTYTGGGGAYLAGAGWRMLDCPSINDNVAYYKGGGACIDGASLVMGCTISNNIVTLGVYAGGGLYLDNGARADACLIVSNMARLGNAGAGGGIYIAGASLASNCTIRANESFQGGGVYMSGGALRNCPDISANRAVGTGTLRGGGVFVNSTVSCAISDCVISNNTSTSRGGGLGITGTGAHTIERCVVVDNQAAAYAGMEVNQSPVTVRNCLITRNISSGSGGGLFLNATATVTPRLESCTIVSNRAQTKPGGLFCQNSNIVVNCIIYSNLVEDLTAGVSVFTNCCTPTAASLLGANNIPDYPAFADPSNNDWRLTADSPCVNAGTNEPWVESAVDLPGHTRADRFSRQVDIGAYEYVPAGSMFELR